MKETWIAGIVIFVLCLAFAFYWFEIKAMSSRVDCAKIALDIKFANQQKEKGKADIKTLDATMQNEYTFCLHGKGY